MARRGKIYPGSWRLRPTLARDPEFEIRARVRSLLGSVGTCRIELHGNGIRIWRGPGHVEPAWSFGYRDLVQAEPTTLIGGSKTPNQTTT